MPQQSSMRAILDEEAAEARALAQFLKDPVSVHDLQEYASAVSGWSNADIALRSPMRAA